MHKRGELVFRYLVMIILALMVLIIVLIYFSQGFDYLFEKIRWALNFVFDLKPKEL